MKVCLQLPTASSSQNSLTGTALVVANGSCGSGLIYEEWIEVTSLLPPLICYKERRLREVAIIADTKVFYQHVGNDAQTIYYHNKIAVAPIMWMQFHEITLLVNNIFYDTGGSLMIQ